MTVKQLLEILSDPMIDDSLEIGYPNDGIEPTGVEPIERIEEVYNGFGQIVGYAVV
jgi:hypothetical protein